MGNTGLSQKRNFFIFPQWPTDHSGKIISFGLGWSTSAVQNCAGPLQLHWSTVGRTHVINPKHQAPDGELNIEFGGRRPLPIVDRLSSSAKLSDPPWGLQGGSKSFGRCPSAALGLGWSTSAVQNCAGPLQLHWSTVGRTHVINPKHQAPITSPLTLILPLPLPLPFPCPTKIRS